MLTLEPEYPQAAPAIRQARAAPDRVPRSRDGRAVRRALALRDRPGRLLRLLQPDRERGRRRLGSARARSPAPASTAPGSRWPPRARGAKHPLLPALRRLTGISSRETSAWSSSRTPRRLPELRWAGRVWRRHVALGNARPAALRRLRAGHRRRPSRRTRRAPLRRRGPRRGSRTSRPAPDRRGGRRRRRRPRIRALLAHVLSGPGRRASTAQRLRSLVANARELAVAVPAGRHRVEFEYDPTPFRWGVASPGPGVSRPRPARRRGDRAGDL